MKVLMTADPVGGVWTYALELVDALAERDVEVTLAVMGGPISDGQRQELRGSAATHVHEGRFALEWMDDAWDDVDRAGAWLLELAEVAAADVVHLNGYAHASLPWPSPPVVVAHSDVCSWWSAVRGGAPPPAWDEYRRRVSAGLAAAGAVVAPTAAYLDELRRWYPVKGGRVIHNGRCRDWVVPAAKEPFVLGAGRLWDEGKNLRLLDAVARRTEWPVVLAGPAGRSQPLRAAHGVGALPFDQLAALLGRAAVFALPARYEPFGLGPLEAALAGCALVLGDIPTLREVWGEAAIYVHPEDERGWASALDGLMAEPARVAAGGAAARRRAEGFGPGAMADAYLDAYRSLPLLSGQPT